MTKHYFNIHIAKEAGVNAAILFQNIAHWIQHNAKQGRNYQEGTHWMFSTQKDIAEQFEYLSVKQCRTAIDKLIELEYLKTGNFNRHAYDRTRWFALTEKGESMVQMEEKHLPVKAIGVDTGGATIPNIENRYRLKNIDPDRVARIRQLCGIS